MGKNKRMAVSTFIRNIYSPYMSYITVKYFNWNLSLQFHPFVSKDGVTGKSFYDYSKSMTTTVSYEGAALLYLVAAKIFDDRHPEREIKAVLPCLKNTALTLEYKPGQNNQWEVYLTIERNNTTIPFKFKTHTYTFRENGQLVTEVIQSGLGAFGKMIEGYLTGINASGHLSKLPEDLEKEFEKYQDESQQTVYTTVNQYQGMQYRENQYQGNQYQGNQRNEYQGNDGGQRQGNYG
jgi:hypothetical protein